MRLKTTELVPAKFMEVEGRFGTRNTSQALYLSRRRKLGPNEVFARICLLNGSRKYRKKLPTI